MILKTKLKNEIVKKSGEMNLDFKLRNISINGVKKGCFGFIVNKDNGLVIYVTTEEPCLSTLHFMYRYAKDTNDSSGYRNHWANTLDELTTSICICLKEKERFRKEKKL